MVNSAEGTKAIALQLCREFEDKFLLHITGGAGSGWKVVARFEGNFPNRIKQLPLDRHFDINNVKRIVLEADGYQPYLISAEKGLRSLIKGVLEPAKEPSRLCVDEGHLFLVRSLLEALGPLLLEQVPLEAQINNHSQHLELVCLVPPHLLVRQVNLHLVQVVLQLLGQPALQPLVLQAPQPSVLQALQPLVQQQLLHLAAQGLHLACQMLLYLDLAEHLELQAALYLVPQAHLHLVPQALLHLVLQLLQLLVPQRLHLVLQALLLLGLLLPCPLALGPLQFLVNQVVDKPAPVRISSLLTSRHLSQRRIRLPARK